MRPRSGLILGSATCGEAASAGGPRTSGVAALMAGAPRGRVPDACGAIVTAGQLAQQWARQRPHSPRITPPALPARGTARTVAGARQNHPRVSPRGARLTPTGGATDTYRSRRRVCALNPPQTLGLRLGAGFTRPA